MRATGDGRADRFPVVETDLHGLGCGGDPDDIEALAVGAGADLGVQEGLDLGGGHRAFVVEEAVADDVAGDPVRR